MSAGNTGIKEDKGDRRNKELKTKQGEQENTESRGSIKNR